MLSQDESTHKIVYKFDNGKVFKTGEKVGMGKLSLEGGG